MMSAGTWEGEEVPTAALTSFVGVKTACTAACATEGNSACTDTFANFVRRAIS